MNPFPPLPAADKAFTVLLKALGVSKKDLLANKELLNTVLKYHVIGKVRECCGVLWCLLAPGRRALWCPAAARPPPPPPHHPPTHTHTPITIARIHSVHAVMLELWTRELGKHGNGVQHGRTRQNLAQGTAQRG